MTIFDAQGHGRSVRKRGATSVVLSAAILLALLGSAPDTAGAVDAPDTGASDQAGKSAAAVAPLTITSPQNDALFPTASVTISGTKDPTGRVDVQSITGGAPYCVVPGGAAWTCTFDAPIGRNTVTVFQYVDGETIPEQSRITIRVLPAPTFTGSSPIVTTGLITGSGFPGSGILLSGSAVGECPGIVQPSGFWSCPLTVTASGDYPISARQTWANNDSEPGGATDTVIIRVDKNPPAYPVFTRPAAGAQSGAQPTLFAGTGENGGRVDVFVDGDLKCSSSVGGGRWSCAAELGAGAHTVQGIQWDAAGNPSGASPGISISVAAATAPKPATPKGSAVKTTPVPVALPSPSRDTAFAPTGTTFPFFPPPVGGISGLPPFDTWDTPTDYGAAIPTVASTGRGNAWLWGLGLGIGFILFVALPLRLALVALRGRFPRHYFARDHSRLTASEIPLLRPKLTVAGAIIAAAMLAALAGGIQGEVRYLRLTIAIGIALLVLNGLTVALTTRFASRALGGESRIRLVPGFLAIAAITALISRGGGIQPPVIVGVVIAASFVPLFGKRSRGLVATIQLTVTMILGLGAWFAHSAIGPVTGFLPSLASETLATLSIAGIGSAIILSLPVSRMPGRLIFEWSPAVWRSPSPRSASPCGRGFGSSSRRPARTCRQERTPSASSSRQATTSRRRQVISSAVSLSRVLQSDAPKGSVRLNWG